MFRARTRKTGEGVGGGLLEFVCAKREAEERRKDDRKRTKLPSGQRSAQWTPFALPAFPQMATFMRDPRSTSSMKGGDRSSSEICARAGAISTGADVAQ